jgi:hypothetical protein
MSVSRARGKSGGRRRALDADKLETLNKLIAEAGERKQDPDYRKIGRIVGVSERTIRRCAAGQYGSQR